MSTSANYFTLPVDISSTPISAFFDHDNTGADIYYDGTSGYFYDNHNGTDFNGDTGDNIIAPADGEVMDVYWNNSGGWTMHIWHEDIGLSTLYAHVATTTVATTSNNVVRGEHVAEMDSTGASSTGSHLHFGVVDSESLSGNRIDPFGWWDLDNIDPWPHNQGYLWTTYPPSFDLASTTGEITTDITWRGNILINGVPTVSSVATLDIDPGTVIKFQTTGSGLLVEGTINSNGSTSSPVYFTSLKDDDAGGDVNQNATTTLPAADDWGEIYISPGGTANFNHSIVRYGSNTARTSNIYNAGGILSFSNSTSTLGSWYGIRSNSGTSTISYSYVGNNFYGVGMQGSATTTITHSKLSDNDIYGLEACNYPYYNILVLTNNQFDNNDSGSACVYINNGLTFTNSGNTASGSGLKKIDFYTGDISSNKTIKGDGLPYVIYTTTIDSGSTLTIEPGAMLKFYSSTQGITVNGTLVAQGATTSPIYFTSYNDHSVGGDSSGSVTSPTGGDWTSVKVNSGGSATLSNAILKYGTTNLHNSGGTFNLSYSTSSSASSYGARSTSGTANITHNNFWDEYFGLSFEGGSLTFTQNNISTTTTYGLQNTTGSSVNIENNYWGNSSGPYHSTLNPTGTGAEISGLVDFDPWLTTWP